jgi:DNA (cytosine-5)-methyltransferase 1
MAHRGSHQNAGGQIAVAVSLRGRESGATAEMGDDIMPSLRCGGGGGDKPHALTETAVRRLTPRECERLQGFPDDYTLIPWRGKPADQCPDGPRYKALGNSMAVPVMAWIGRRIEMVRQILAEQKDEKVEEFAPKFGFGDDANIKKLGA